MNLEETLDLPQKPRRDFVPESLTITQWEDLQPYFEDLLSRTLDAEADLLTWLRHESELSAIIAEEAAWRYIAMTTDTASQEKAERYKQFVTQIQPHIAKASNALNRKLYDAPLRDTLTQKPSYAIMLRRISDELEIYREDNLDLQAQIQAEQQQFGTITGAMTVELDGEEMTLQKAASLLQDNDRSKRQQVWEAIQQRRLQDRKALDDLFDALVSKRNQVALNAGMANYRDYAFRAMSRHDYTPQDCFAFHESVAKHVVPLLDEMARQRKTALGLEQLRPWDMQVDPSGKPKLQPFQTIPELVERTVEALDNLHPRLGECLLMLKKMNRLDLDSRKGKAPGGYNYPLLETGVPFIFANATSTLRDLVTLLHESGHAVHSIFTHPLELTAFKSLTPEIAELASMSMELLTLDQWGLFFPDEEDLKRAQRNHLEDILFALAWIALIDRFQHWLYENPNHTAAERAAQFTSLHQQYSSAEIDWSGYEDQLAASWQKQIHLFDFPFYYIEYGMAQLGAIGVWKNYQANPQKAIYQYMSALERGYTAPIPAIYQAAGVSFDFSEGHIAELMAFLQQKIAGLQP